MQPEDHSGKPAGLTEHGLIARYFRPLAEDLPGAFGLLDDAAAIRHEAGSELVVTTDALVAGVHFFADDAPAGVAFKSLAVNVSDLAAKAARPLAYSLALVMPRGTGEGWIADFASGLAEAQKAFGILMSGGDTAVSKDGPLMISITAFGEVPAGRMVKRGGGRAGDTLYVTGTIGDAALGLSLRLGGPDAAGWPLDADARRFLLDRYLRPVPRLALREALRAHASAAMDVSDGLAIDASRLCRASGASGRIEAARTPLSKAARAVIAADPANLETALTGGDDYEILAAVPPEAESAFEAKAAAAHVPVTRIGALSEGGGGLSLLGANGEPLSFKSAGYDHLSG